ncbi:hypothetical protein K501DRAFT_337023 [Backusella circina FSU 941]|nr:hypothetical protein K501DRAFT_337023 [Backusella circina FSU 941]
MVAGAALYYERLNNYVNYENSKQTANMLSITDNHVNLLIQQNLSSSDLQPRNNLDAPWNEIATLHLKTIISIDNGDYEDAYESQKDLVQAFQRGMSGMTRWCLQPLYVVNNDLRTIAAKADLQVVAVEGQRKKLEDAANIISKSFTYCITDRGPSSTSKKYGTYCMIGILFRIYFKLKQQNLCKNILRAVKAADMPSLEEFPKSDRVTFRYYLGRLYFLEEDYAKAEIELDAASRECTVRNRKNKELILQTLLPVKLMRGILPSPLLFERYPSINATYGVIAESTKQGNVKIFNEALRASESNLIRRGTYFAIEKAESIVIRQLFRKVYLIQGSNSRIPIQTFEQALLFQGLDIVIQEAEWMIANMISKGYIRGYLSHEKMFLVLSKENPFPPVSTIAQS